MASLAELTNGMSPVVAYPKTIQFGPVSLDGYMLESGEFRQSVASSENAIGDNSSKGKLFTRLFVPRSDCGSQTPLAELLLNQVSRQSQPSDGRQANPLQANESQPKMAPNGRPHSSDLPIVVPVRCPGVISSTIYTINLPTVVEGWKLIAMSNSKYARAALEMLGLSAIHSLERAYQEAFHVEDARSTTDRLLEWAIRLDAGKHFPLFGGQFHQHFTRVTGVTVGHRYAKVCLAELVYHRLPVSVYETLKDLNPMDPETGWRQFSHSQLMTDDMRQYVREIVMAVTNQLANTPSKADDSSGYRKLLHRLDKTLPRHINRRNALRKAAA
jgi:hypothetical protein